MIRQGPRAVADYLSEAKALGFDVLEISTGFISLPQVCRGQDEDRTDNIGIAYI